MRYILVWLIRLYQRTLSRVTPPMCRFQPSCSEYARQAIALHGAWHGTWLGIKRLARCHPFAAGGYDPVPGIAKSSENTSTDTCDNRARSDEE